MIRKLHSHIGSLQATLWTLIVAPTTWAVHFLFSYLWAAVYCAKTGQFAEEPLVYWVGTGLALLVIAISGYIAVIQSRVPGDPAPHEHSTESDRLRFIAYSTMLLAGLSVIGVIFTAAPVLILEDCR